MRLDNLAIIDVETTGSTSGYDRIIEVGILRVEGGKVVKTFESLINPEVPVSPYVEVLTGITGESLSGSPTFYEIKDEVSEILKDAIFVAHNSRFDYSFIKNEFKRYDIDYRAKQLCTVKLSRLLFPRYKKHSLDNIIERFSITCERRHRALDDAKVVWEFLQKIPEIVEEEKSQKAFTTVLKRPSLPPQLLNGEIEKLPESPGVYMFFGDSEMPLYIGKSVNIKDRVLSHFSNDTESSRELEITQQIKRIESIKTAGELGALILESELVKKLQPVYNRKLRYSSRLTYFEKKMSPEGYFSVITKTTNEIEADNIENILAIVKSKKQAVGLLSDLVKEYNLCDKLLGLQSTQGACFSHHLGRCKGACVNKEESSLYNMRFTLAFGKTKLSAWPFKGPIVVKEKNDETEEGLVFDKWCYLGKYEEVLNSEKRTDMVLTDFDVYKILRSFIRDSKNIKKIFTFNNLSELGLLSFSI